MRVFMTGASGFVGSATTKALLKAGHAVRGLARSEESAAKLERLGATAVRGELKDVDLLAAEAKAAEGVIHCGFIHDFANFSASAVVDKAAIETFGKALAGSGKPFIATAGTAALRSGRVGTEDEMPDPDFARHLPRVSEVTALAFAGKGLRAMVVRLPPSVHGDHDHGFVPRLIEIAREKGSAAYVGEGGNRWPAVHVGDAAEVYRLALEKGADGARYHAIGDEGVAFREIAALIGRKLRLPVVSVTREGAPAQFGWLANFAAMDVPASGRLTEERLGSRPVGPGLIADMETGTYFA
jgi:nucleoside-diphosphate-sugar epimerase